MALHSPVESPSPHLPLNHLNSLNVSVLGYESGKFLREENIRDKYEMMIELGKGSFGSVFKARCIETDEIVAVKVMEFVEQGEQDWEDIVREVTITQSLEYENVIHFIDSFLEPQCIYMVLDFCQGTVADILDVTSHGLEEDQIAAVLYFTLKALAYVHSKGYVHRDVKASNILISPQGAIELGDFGSSSMSEHPTSFVGTPCWMAPEVIQSMDPTSPGYTNLVDIWSLGITCIEMAEKKPPLYGLHSVRIIYMIPAQPPPTLSHPDRWSQNFADFVSKCLQKDPALRWSATALLEHPFILGIRDRAESLVHALVYQAAAAAVEVAPPPISPRSYQGTGDNFSSGSLQMGPQFSFAQNAIVRDSRMSDISTISHLSDPQNKGAIRTSRLICAPEDDLERDLDTEAKHQLKKISKTIQQHRKQIANLKRTQQFEIDEFKKAAEKEYLQFSMAQAEERERVVAKQKKKEKKGKSSIRGSLKKLMDKTRKSIVDDSFWQTPSSSSNPQSPDREEAGHVPVPHAEDDMEGLARKMTGYMALIEFDKNTADKKRQLLMKQEAVYNSLVTDHVHKLHELAMTLEKKLQTIQVSFLLDLQRQELKAFDLAEEIQGEGKLLASGNQKKHDEALQRQQIHADTQQMLLTQATRQREKLAVARTNSDKGPTSWNELSNEMKDQLLKPPAPRARSRSQSESDSFDYGGMVKPRAQSFHDLNKLAKSPDGKEKSKASVKPNSPEREALLTKHRDDLRLMTETQSQKRKDLREHQRRELAELLEANKNGSEQLQKRLQEEIETIVSEGNMVIQGLLAEQQQQQLHHHHHHQQQQLHPHQEAQHP